MWSAGGDIERKHLWLLFGGAVHSAPPCSCFSSAESQHVHRPRSHGTTYLSRRIKIHLSVISHGIDQVMMMSYSLWFGFEIMIHKRLWSTVTGSERVLSDGTFSLHLTHLFFNHCFWQKCQNVTVTPVAALMHSFNEVISNVCFLNVLLVVGQDGQTEMIQSDILLPELWGFLRCSQESRPSVMCDVIYTNMMKVCKGCWYCFWGEILSKPWLVGNQMDSVWDDVLSSCLTEAQVLAALGLELPCLCFFSSLFSPCSPTTFTEACGKRQC